MHNPNILGAALSTKLPRKNLDHLNRAVAHVVMHYPGFLQALFQDSEIQWSTDVSIAAIVSLPGRRFRILLNPEVFAELPTPEIVFILCHEGLHRILQHLPFAKYAKRHGVPISQAVYDGLPPEVRIECTRVRGGWALPFDQKLLNVADDFIINYQLREAGIGKQPVFDPATDITPGNCPISLTLETSSSDVYAALWIERDPGQRIPNPLEVYVLDAANPSDSAGTGTDSIDTPNQLAQAASIAIEQAQQLQANTRAGKGAGMLNQLADLVDQSQIDWREELTQDIISRNAKGSEESWDKLSRRHLAMNLTWPGRVGRRARTIVCFHDTSGSVSEREAGMYYAEVAAALSQCRPERIIVLPVDTRVYDPVILTDDGNLDFHSALVEVHAELRGKYPGGGGTSFNPGFAWVEEHLSHEPISQALYFTDGYGRCTVDPPPYPVTWVTTGGAKFPFGKVIQLCD